MALPQPITIPFTPEQLRDRFIRVTVDTAPDPKWHYRIAVPHATKMRPNIGRTAPSSEAPIQSLGLFYREDVEMDLEIVGVLLGREIDPFHWLELYLDYNGLKVSSLKALPLTGGIVGDAVCEWTADGKPFAGRFVALKFGPRLYVVCCRASRETYAAHADEFFVSLTQFGAVDDSLGLCAEPVTKVGAPKPVPWFLFVPGSWQLTAEDYEGGQAGFQAAMSGPLPGETPVASALSPFPGGEAGPAVELPPADSYLGKMAVTLLPQSMAPTPEAAEEGCLDTFRGAGLELDREEFEDEPTQGALEKSRLLITSARLAGQEGVELRCRVGFVKGLWFVAGVVGPARQVNPFAWMQNKRTLDVVTGSLQFGPDLPPGETTS
jgi:hypothetical protein